jgi:cellulose synthase (UDP-forming)
VTPERVFRWWDYPLFIGLSVLGLVAIGLFAAAWVRHGSAQQQPILYLLITALLFPILANQQGRWFLLLAMRRPRPLTPPAGLRVAVVTTYVPGVESRQMVEQSLAALVAIRYPHDTWLLDEGGDTAMQALCARLGVHYFSRKDRPEYQAEAGRLQSASKYGNYNSWLDAMGFEQYDALVAFDPDHVASPDCLEQVLGYFRDPRVAYVQPAQAYYNQRASFIARGAAEETYAYYSSVQMASYGVGYPVIIGGHNAHRMSALKGVGGFAAHDADDVLLTLMYRAAGWQGVYLPRILARGLVPVDWRGYLAQQRRWARAVLDIKLRRRARYVWNLPLGSRVLSFLHGANFLYRHVVAMFGFLLMLSALVWAGTSGAPRVEILAPIGLLWCALVPQELYRQRFYLDWRREGGVHWRAALLQYAAWPWFILALMDVIVDRRPAYVVTRKSRQASRYLEFIGVHLAIAAVVALAWVAGLALGQSAGPVVMVLAGFIIVAQLALVATELRGFPSPWEPTIGLPAVGERARPSCGTVFHGDRA